MDKNSRYSRQITLSEIGIEGQKRIRAASILCVGAGGLGCPALLYLAAAGVGRIGIIDFDTVEESNLHRQVLFTMDDIGKNKAEAAARRLNALNPDCTIEVYARALDTDNVEEIFSRYDIVLDGTDNFATKYLINDTAVKTRKPFIHSALQGFTGQICVFDPANGPCYRCLYPEAPRHHVPTCAEAGIIGSVAGTIGVMQATEAIKIIVAHPSLKPLYGRMLNFDMYEMRPRVLNIPKSAECAACAHPENIELNSSQSLLCDTRKTDTMIENISAEEAQESTNALLVDVRELDEWESGHAANAIHVPLSLLLNNEEIELPQDQDIILYCQKGMRSLYAAQILQSRGYERLKNVTGGYEAWPPE